MATATAQGLDDRGFEEWLLAARASGELRNPEALAGALLDLDTDAVLGASERKERAHRMLVFLDLPPATLLSAWGLIAARANTIAGSVIAVLPATMKQAALAMGRPLGTPAAEPGLEQQVEPRPVQADPKPPEPQEQLERAFVVLLGTSNEFGATMALLGNSGFNFLLCESLGEVSDDARLQTCALVIGKSRYAALGADDQLAFFREAARWNLQVWTRIGLDGLAERHAGDLKAFRESLGFTRGRADSIHVAEASELTQGDLGYVFPFAQRLVSCLDCSLLVDGLTEQQALLVAMAVRSELEAVKLENLMKKSISVQVTRGKSKSLILMCRVEGCTHPFVLRLGPRAILLDGPWAELPKIENLILPWNPDLAPSVYGIGDDGVLVYKSIRNVENPNFVATTLAASLEQLQAAEPPYPPEDLPDPRSVEAAIDEAFSLLVGLNRTTSDAVAATNYQWIVDDYRRMEAAGKSFVLAPDLERPALGELLETALANCPLPARGAVVHGDPHTKNVVLPAASHAELIDFEQANVGHPLYDVCHLTVSICATTFRPYDGFERMVGGFREGLFGEARPGPAQSSSVVNDIVTHALASSRRAANILSAHYGLDRAAFPSMLILVSAVALMFLPQLNAEVVRALVCAARLQTLIVEPPAEPAEPHVSRKVEGQEKLFSG